jgi:hypothetical protein
MYGGVISKLYGQVKKLGRIKDKKGSGEIIGNRKQINMPRQGLPVNRPADLKKPGRTFWGGYSGFIAGPENNIWEICYNPVPETKA